MIYLTIFQEVEDNTENLVPRSLRENYAGLNGGGMLTTNPIFNLNN
jgi:hypothetical protein